MLLIPESFDNYWNVQLQVGETAHVLQGNLDLGKLQCTLNTDPRTNSFEAPIEAKTIETQNSFEIFTNETIAVSPEVFTGDQILSLSNTLLDQELQLIGAQGVIGHGVLARIGKGYGLYITQTVKQA